MVIWRLHPGGTDKQYGIIHHVILFVIQPHNSTSLCSACWGVDKLSVSTVNVTDSRNL